MIFRIARFIFRLVATRQAYKFFIKDWTELTDLHTAAFVSSTMRFSQNLQPLVMNNPLQDNILVIAPHPDDEILGPGGTLIKCLNLGKKIQVIHLTNGDPAHRIVNEAKAVAEGLGFETFSLDLPVLNIPIDTESLQACARIINNIKPKCIFIPFLLDDHDDHRRASEFLYTLVKKEFINTRSIEIWGYQVYTALPPNVIVDITDVAEKKSNAIKKFKSQMEKRDYAHYSLGLNAFNSRFLKGKGPLPKYVEAFFVLPYDEYEKLCEYYFENPKNAYYSKNYTSLTNCK